VVRAEAKLPTPGGEVKGQGRNLIISITPKTVKSVASQVKGIRTHGCQKVDFDFVFSDKSA
jgi:hypothetical protein